MASRAKKNYWLYITKTKIVVKQVFLSADDFGRSPNRNKAIDESFKKGLIKSAGLIVTGQYLQDAVNYINSGDYVNHVHCHINLSGNVEGENTQDIPLTDRMKRDKTFCKEGMFRTFYGIPKSPKYIVKFIKVYKELAAQYNKFLEITGGKGNRNHIDFHLWYNLFWPTAVALNIFTLTHRIKSVRYIGIHHEHHPKKLYRIIRKFSWNPFVSSYHSSNIDGFLSKPEWFDKYKSFELYCHPDSVDGKLLDNSISYFGNEKQLLETNIELLKENQEIELVSWADEE